MKFIPHDYQKFCIDYIKVHPISALFLDMGLGKTVITLTAIRDLMLDDLLVSKTLVIGPLRVARDTWPAEVEKSCGSTEPSAAWARERRSTSCCTTTTAPSPWAMPGCASVFIA